jgi:solute:Na+ symporter, SSS family
MKWRSCRVVPLAALCLFVCGQSAIAADGDAAAHQPGLIWIDWVIIGASALSTILMGWYYGRTQTSIKEYFIGSGRMNPLLIGVSLFASLLSTISYLSIPGETLGKGPVYLTNYFAYPLAFYLIGFVILPVYMKQHVTSAYELLEERLGLSIRLLGASLFLVLRLVWMTLLIYLTAKAIATMIGAGEKWITLIVLLTGIVSVTYAAMGGLRAVVVTDVAQTLLLYGGAVLVIATISMRMGGFSWMPTEWAPNWDTQPLYSFDPSTRVTVVGTMMSVLIWMTCTSGGDQVSVQRFMATENVAAARRAIGMQLIISCIVGVTLGLAGFAMLGYFNAHPEMLPARLRDVSHADEIFPYFIAYHLPPVVSGLVVSGLFAAAMSSIDSGVNSITAVVSRDFIDRFRHKPISETHHVWIARIIAFTIGTVVTVGSAYVGKVPGNITAVTNKTVNLLTVPIFGLFFFALFVKFAKPAAVWIATLASTAVAASIAFSGPLVLWLHDAWGIDPAVFRAVINTAVDPQTGEIIRTVPDPITFQWIPPVTLVVNVAVGMFFSLILPGRRPPDVPREQSA